MSTPTHPMWSGFYMECAHPATCGNGDESGRYNANNKSIAGDYAALLADMATPEESRPPEANEVWALFVTYQLTGGRS